MSATTSLQIRSCCSEVIIDTPSASQTAGATLSSGREGKQRDNVAQFSVENLFVCRVRGRTSLDLARILTFFEISPNVFDVAHEHVGALVIQVCVLTTTDRANVRGDAHVDDDVLFGNVAIDV